MAEARVELALAKAPAGEAGIRLRAAVGALLPPLARSLSAEDTLPPQPTLALAAFSPSGAAASAGRSPRPFLAASRFDAAAERFAFFLNGMRS